MRGVKNSRAISVRVSKDSHDWLTQNTTQISGYVRRLIEEAQRKDQQKPLDERMSETEKELNESQQHLDSARRNAWADTLELKGTINFYAKDVKRLKAKLALLST
jgi:hypothetical protein